MSCACQQHVRLDIINTTHVTRNHLTSIVFRHNNTSSAARQSKTTMFPTSRARVRLALHLPCGSMQSTCTWSDVKSLWMHVSVCCVWYVQASCLFQKQLCEGQRLACYMAQYVSSYKAIVNVLPDVCEHFPSGQEAQYSQSKQILPTDELTSRTCFM